MDIQIISTIAAAAVGFIVPYLGKAGEAVGKMLGEDIYKAVKSHFSHKPGIQETLKDLEEAPDDPELQAILQTQLKRLLKEDEAFTLELQRMLKKEAQTEPGSTIIQQTAGDNAKLFGQVFGNVTIK